MLTHEPLGLEGILREFDSSRYVIEPIGKMTVQDGGILAIDDSPAAASENLFEPALGLKMDVHLTGGFEAAEEFPNPGNGIRLPEEDRLDEAEDIRLETG